MSDTFAYGPVKHPRKKAVLGFILGLALIGGAAVAAWTINAIVGGTGAGKVKVGALTAPTFQAVVDAEITDTIFPGETGDLTFKVNNANAGTLKLTSLAGAATISVTDGAPAGACNSSNFTFVPYSNPTGINVTSGVSVVTVPGTISMNAGAETGCQGDTVAVSGMTATFST